jgi:hypothetical protein
MEAISQLVDAILRDDKLEANRAFSTAMKNKVRSEIDIRRIETAQKIYDKNAAVKSTV